MWMNQTATLHLDKKKKKGCVDVRIPIPTLLTWNQSVTNMKGQVEIRFPSCFPEKWILVVSSPAFAPLEIVQGIGVLLSKKGNVLDVTKAQIAFDGLSIAFPFQHSFSFSTNLFVLSYDVSYTTK